jgi:hypothetical protein
VSAAKSDQRWKAHTPCRDAGDPGLFEVPNDASAEEWRLAEKVATTYCAGCPFLLGECAKDPDGRWNIWAGSARWVRGSEVLFRRLIPNAPRPPFANTKNMTPDPALRRKARRTAA